MPRSKNYFYTVTKEYYDNNIFKYDELYELNIIPRNIFIPFQIHRMEIYIEKNYKPIEKLLKTANIRTEDVSVRAMFGLSSYLQVCHGLGLFERDFENLNF